MVSLLAACRKLVTVIKLILQFFSVLLLSHDLHSCDFNLRDKDGRTALHIAVTMKNSQIVKLLISKGIDITIKDNTGRTAEQLSYDLVSDHSMVCCNNNAIFLCLYREL